MYWHQGFAEAPVIVKRCVEHWKKLHPDWSIKLLDQYNVVEYIDPPPISNQKLGRLSLPHQSDLIRTQLLIRYGGVWVDPTAYCLKSLDSWLPEYLTSGLFMFHKPGRDRVVANWFIVSEARNILLSRLLESLSSYWNDNEFLNFKNKSIWYMPLLSKVINRSFVLSRIWFNAYFLKFFRVYPYMVYHYMFYDLIMSNPECRAIYKAMPKFSADFPHVLQRIGLLKPLTAEVKSFIDEKKSPIVKLSWKIDISGMNEGTVLDYLFQNG